MNTEQPPEPLAAILAEMRELAAKRRIVGFRTEPERLLDFASRIEDAAYRGLLGAAERLKPCPFCGWDMSGPFFYCKDKSPDDPNGPRPLVALLIHEGPGEGEAPCILRDGVEIVDEYEGTFSVDDLKRLGGRLVAKWNRRN